MFKRILIVSAAIGFGGPILGLPMIAEVMAADVIMLGIYSACVCCFVFYENRRAEKEIERLAVVDYLSNAILSVQSAYTIAKRESSIRLLLAHDPNFEHILKLNMNGFNFGIILSGKIKLNLYATS